MDFWTLTLLTVVIYFTYRYFKKNLSYFEENEVPFVAGWPLLGNMAAAFFRRQHVSQTIIDLYNTHPHAKYIGIFDFVRPIVMIRDPEIIKSVTIKNFDNFPDHKIFVDEKLDPLFGGNLFSMVGERWKETRNLLSPAFTSSKMKAMHELMVECAKNFVKHLDSLPDNQRQMVDTKDLFTKFTNDAIATCAFGISIDSLKDPTNDFYVLGRKATNLDGIMTLKFFISRSFPAVMRFFNIRFVSEQVAQFFENVVSNMVKTRDEKGISRPDMIQLMMNARGKTSDKLKLDITQMTAQAFIFFFGGFDTTSTQMCIIAHELAINPDIQKRLQNEIDEVVVKSGGNPSYEDIQGMTYLDAVFNESMRRHTQVPFTDRLCSRSLELPPSLPGGKPFTLQPGMNIWIPAAAIHKDPKYYENPYVFDPDRYYEKKVNLNDTMNLGFGIGPRGCIGNRFAILETKVLFFHVLSKFNLKANKKTCSPLEYSKSNFSVSAKDGFWLAVEKRK